MFTHKKTMTLAIIAEGRLDQQMFMTSKTFIWLMQDHAKHTLTLTVTDTMCFTGSVHYFHKHGCG